MLNRKQAQYESIWKHVERENSVKKRLNQYYLDVGNVKERIKENTMQNVTGTQWTLEDLNKLKANKDRPMNELILIFKNRFNGEQIREKKAQIISELTQKGQPKKKTGGLSKFSDDEFRIMYDHRELKKRELLLRYPELKKNASELTVFWYVDAIRAELKGTQTMLSQHFYDLLRLWYNSTNAVQMPQRGSKSIRSDVKRYRAKSSKTKAVSAEPTESKASKESEIVKDVISNVVKEKKVQEGGKEDSKCTSTLALDLTKLKYTHAAEEKYGLLVNGELKIVCDNQDQVSGAEQVYRQLGLISNIKKVKMLIETID